MSDKPSYQDLEQQVRRLERAVAGTRRADDDEILASIRRGNGRHLGRRS